MLDAAFKAFAQMFTAPFRGVLLKSVGLAILLLILLGLGLHRLFAWLAAQGAAYLEGVGGSGLASPLHALLWVLAIAAGFGLAAGAIFIMPAVSAFVASFFSDEIAAEVEHMHYPADPPGSAVPVTHPRMIAPQTASPGEQITVLVYAYRGRCGPTELRLDNLPVKHRLNRYLGSPNPDWIEMFMILDVPTGAFPGRHEIQLYGPDTGQTGTRCGTNPTDRTLLATLAITLGP